MAFLSLSSCSALFGWKGGVQLSYESAIGFSDSAETDVLLAKLYWAGYPSGFCGLEDGGPSEFASPPPKGARNPGLLNEMGSLPIPSASSSSSTGWIDPATPLLSSGDPKGFELAPNGLVKPLADIMIDKRVHSVWLVYDCLRFDEGLSRYWI